VRESREDYKMSRTTTRVLATSVAFALLSGVALVAGASPAGATHGAAADQAAAEASVFVLGDFNSDWSEGTAISDFANFQRAAKKVASCKAYLKALTAQQQEANASSSPFVNGDALAYNSVVVFNNTTDAVSSYAAFSQPTTARCLTQTARQTLSKALGDTSLGGKVGKVSATVKRGSTAVIADRNTAWETTATVTKKNGKKAKVYLNVEDAVVGRGLVSDTFISVGKPLDGIHDHLVASSVGRLQSALGLMPAGETANLASALTPIPGYAYVEATPEQLQKISEQLADPELRQYVEGESVHTVVRGDVPVGLILLMEFKQQYASQPGFKADALTGFSSGYAESSNGQVEASTLGGQPVVKVTGATGRTAHLFFVRNIMGTVISADDPAAAEAFVAKFVGAAGI